MIIQKEESPFLQETESRFDIRDTGDPIEISTKAAEAQNQSEFISEINRRFLEIFGDDHKKVSVVAEPNKTDAVDQVTTRADAEGNGSDELHDDILSGSALPLRPSTLESMQSILLALENEISDGLLGEFQDEVDHLGLLYSDDRIIQGFLRILRFVGRCLMVRRGGSQKDSIDLLLSVFRHLKNVTGSDGLTKDKKRILLIESIYQYRFWAKKVNLDERIDHQTPEADSQDNPEQKQPAGVNETTLNAFDGEVEKAFTAFKDLPSHEALTQTLDTMKKIYQAKIDALNEEIKILKMNQ